MPRERLFAALDAEFSGAAAHEEPDSGQAAVYFC